MVVDAQGQTQRIEARAQVRGGAGNLDPNLAADGDLSRHYCYLPSMRMTEWTSRTASSSLSVSTVSSRSFSVALCVTTTSRAPSSSLFSWRTVFRETLCFEKALEISASTPTRSSTSMSTWYRVTT